MVQVLREDGNVIGVGEYVCVWVCWNGYLVHEKVGKCRWIVVFVDGVRCGQCRHIYLGGS